MPMATMAAPTTDAWGSTLTLLRWRQTRRGYDADDALLATSFRLLESDSDGQFGPQSALRDAEQRCNIPADRIATELLHFALLLITKPRRDESGAKTQSSGVLRLLHLTLKALRATSSTTTAGLSIPMNACNMLLAAMADALESLQVATSDDDAKAEATRAVNDVLQVFVFLFGMDDVASTPSFNMYKPPTNVYSEFMQRACTALFARLDNSGGSTQNALLVRLSHAIMRVFQELQHTQVNKKKVFVSITKTSFRDIVGYRHALAQRVQIDGVAAVLALLDRIIVDALFDPEHLREYDGALVHLRMWSGPHDTTDEAVDSHKQKKTKRKHGGGSDAAASSLVSYQRHLFDEITAFLKDDAVPEAAKASIGALLQVLVGGYSTRIRAAAHDKIQDTRADVKSSKKRVATVIASTSTAYTPFKFWAELCGLVFQCALPVSTLVALCDSLFTALCDADVYRVTEDTEEQEQFAMMQRVLARLTDTLLEGEGVTSPSIAGHVCSVLAHAVQCTPNLVNQSLVPVFRVLGACSQQSLDAASDATVQLLHAYESMRLVDAFLRACCAIDDDDTAVADGLQAALTHRTCETALRRTFLSLPPGQVEIVWRLLTDKLAVLCGRQRQTASKMALVRGIFALFLQETHITPQNRAKIGELVAETHDKLLATLASKAVATKHEYSTVQRELFSLFGEFLALYDGLAPTTRAQTLDTVIDAVGSRLVAVLTSLFSGSDARVVGAAAGVIKIGIHSLRRREDEQPVAALIVDRVMQWKCWDAVAFYLPELVAGVTATQATELFAALVTSYLAPVTHSDHGAATRILRDAAFYEIYALQQVAPAVFTQVIKTASSDRLAALFDFLRTVPQGYLDASLPESQELLTTVLQLHLKLTPDEPAQPLIAQWIGCYLLSITASSTTATKAKTLKQWLAFLLLESPVDTPTVRLLRVAVEYARVDAGAVAAPLTKLVNQQTPRALSTIASVIEASAPLHQLAVTAEFVTAFIAKAQAQSSLLTGGEDSSFQLFTALLTFLAAVPDASPLRQPIQQLLRPHLATTLSTATQSVVHSTSHNASHSRFFTTVCSSYHALGTAVTTLETFGCLLAVALASAHVDDAPLASLVLHCTKDEFRLLVSTLLQELHTASPSRVLAALKTLALVLETDRKLSPSRRQLLSEVKATFVERFVHITAHALAQPPSTATVDLVVASLRVVVLFYCKAELFTWKPHELLQVFAGFAPLHAIAGAQCSAAVWTATHVHTVWLLSYSLLLRIVRHHFVSLVNAVPHIVSALNALLRVLLRRAADGAATASTLEWASNLARLYGYLKPHDAALRKHVVYVLVPYLRGVTQGKLSLPLQLKLRPGVFALLEICSLNEKEQLYASLDAAGKSLLKAMDTQFKLSHRYVGKV